MARRTTNTNKLLPLLTVALALAACEAGSGDTGDATESATTAPGETGETGAPTTGPDVATGGSSGDGETTGDASSGGGETVDATTGGTGGETSAEETGEGTTGEPIDEPEIAGMYTDEYGSMHTIDAMAWKIDTSVFHVLAVDNDTDHLVAENDAANDFNPELFSRFDWYLEGDVIYYCQTAYDAASQAAAEATPAADSADLMMGCGGFPWTLLTP